MNSMIRCLKKSSAATLAAALLFADPAAMSWAQVTAVANPGAAPVASGAAGAAIRQISVTPRLGGSAIAGPSLRSGLPPSAAPQPTLQHGLEVRPLAAVAAAAAAQAAAPGLQLVPAADRTDNAEPAVTRAENAEARPVRKAAPKTSPLRRMLSALNQTVRRGRTQDIFDGTGGSTRGLGILPEEGARAPGVELGPRPQQPGETETQRVTWNRLHIPGAADQPTLLGRIFRRSSVQPVTLPGDPNDARGVEAALRDLVASDPRRFGGLSPDSLQTVVSRKVAGREGLADTVYVSFRQHIRSLPVEGTYLSFTVKLIGGKAVLVSSSAQLYPRISVHTMGRLSDGQVLQKAFDRLGRPADSRSDLRRVGKKIMHLGGRWRAVHLVFSESKTLIAAVDINTGESFAWDARMTLLGNREDRAAERALETEPAPDGVAGRGVADGPQKADTPITTLPLGHIQIQTSQGKKYYADAQGKFVVEGKGDQPIELTVRLTGRYVTVQDQEGKDLVLKVTAKPGETLQAIFNPQGADENAVAQVNAYYHTTHVHDWLAARGVEAEDMNQPIRAKVNIDQDCNAYYTPWNPSINFFKASSRCVNTGYSDVIIHEDGHAYDDAIGGIVHSALSEGWGDIIAMYMTAQPIIGRGFFNSGSREYIRNGENDYQYRSRDEAHEQGQAFMGFAWKLRKALIASFEAAGLTSGQAADKASAVAENLVLPVLYANVRSIPAAIEAVLLRDLDESGHAPHFKEIQAAAQAHDISVKEPRPGEVAAGVVRTGFTARLAGAVTGFVRTLRG
ncbi:MAG: hypothetical protein ABII00_03265 [Elusimicrobiota bacterium]